MTANEGGLADGVLAFSATVSSSHPLSQAKVR